MNVLDLRHSAQLQAGRLLVLVAVLGIGTVLLGGLAVALPLAISGWLPAPVAAVLAAALLLVACAQALSVLRERERMSVSGPALARRLGAAPLDDAVAAHRHLRSTAEEVAVLASAAVPALHVLDDESINALALGDRAALASVVVTRGALERLDHAELKALLAHAIVRVLAGQAAADLRASAALVGFDRPWQAMLRVLGIGALAPHAAALRAALPLVMTRDRIFSIDAAAARLTGDALALRSVLRRVAIEASGPVAPVDPLKLRAGPDLRDPRFSGHAWFVPVVWWPASRSVHAPIGARIARLLELPQAYRWANEPGETSAPADGVTFGAWLRTLAVALQVSSAGPPLAATPAAELVSRLRGAQLEAAEVSRWLSLLVAGSSGAEPTDPRMEVALHWLIHPHGSHLRVAVLELLLGRLRDRGVAQRTALLEACRPSPPDATISMASPDRSVPAAWVRFALAGHRLGRVAGTALGEPVDDRPGRRQRRRIEPKAHSRALAVLFAMAAIVGETSLRTARDTLAEAAARLVIQPPASIPESIDYAAVSQAMVALLEIPESDKPALMQLLEQMARVPADLQFDAFMRAVAAAIDCPVHRPTPVVPEVDAGRVRAARVVETAIPT